jgi:uncharacterized protein with GYD domain
MAVFIVAMTINPNAKKLKARLNEEINNSFDVFKENKIRVSNLYATLGRYDFLAVFEAVDQTAAFKVTTEINNKGVLETETWPVIPYEEFTRLLS